MTTTLITGNTYPIREQLRALGGSWNSSEQGWDVPSDKAAEANALLSTVPAKRKGNPNWRPRRYVNLSGWMAMGRND